VALYLNIETKTRDGIITVQYENSLFMAYIVLKHKKRGTSVGENVSDQDPVKGLCNLPASFFFSTVSSDPVLAYPVFGNLSCLAVSWSVQQVASLLLLTLR
jgi:hypothetical protein